MRTRDAGWDRLVKAIQDAMSQNAARQKNGETGVGACTAGELADGLAAQGVDAADVRNWLRGRGNPRLDLIPEIATVLAGETDGSPGWDVLALPKAMGVVPNSEGLVPELIYSISKLQSRLTKLQQQVGQFGAELGPASVVRRACHLAEAGSAVWAVASWPAVEGPADCRVHVADRLDFRRIDGREATADDVRDNFQDALFGVGAVRGAASPRWVETSGAPDPFVSQWAIPHLGGPRSSTIRAPWPGMPSVVVVSTTVRSWANDVASHLADALGYGQTSTRDLSMDLTGYRRGSRADVERDSIQQWLMRRPQSKRVWSHWSVREALPDPEESTDVVVVVLREDDTLLRRESQSSEEHEELTVLRTARDALLIQADKYSKRVVLDVALPTGTTSEVRDSRFEQALTCALTTLEVSLREGWLDGAALASFWAREAERRPSEEQQRPFQVQAWLGKRLRAQKLM